MKGDMDMTREEAMEILAKRGWNEDGAEALLDQLEDDELELTAELVTRTAEDYEDR